MENYKYMIDIMNKVNEEYFKMDTPSVNAEGVQKDYDELLEKHHELAEKYSEIAYENEALRKGHEELIMQYHQLQSEHTSLQHRYDKLISKIESIRDSMKEGSND